MPWTRVEIDECEKRLASIAAALEQRESVSLEEARELMRNASGRWLLSFDLASRWRSFWGYGVDPKRNLIGWLMRQPDGAQTEILLFVQSCTNSGFVRERALQSPKWPCGRLTCAAALIRLEDWVPQVAAAARQLFEKLATSDSARHLFGLLDLVAALSARSRFAAQWSSIVEPVLLAPRWREARHEALSARDGPARRLAYKLCLAADVKDALAVLRRALSDSSVRNALWAMDEVSRWPASMDQLDMLRAALAHRLGAVRAGALRQMVRLDVEDLRELLISHLFDHAHAARGVAAFHLQERFGEPALDYWRAEFDAGRHRDLLTGVLAEFGGSEDQDRLRSQLGHRNSRVRAAALLGLCRSGAKDREELVRRALTDPSTRVIAAAIDGLVLCKLDVSTAELANALANARSSSARARLIAAARLLTKWDRLEYTVSLYQRCPPEEWHLLASLLRAWEAGFNRSYVNIDSARRQDLLEKIAAVSRLDPRLQMSRLTELVR